MSTWHSKIYKCRAILGAYLVHNITTCIRCMVMASYVGQAVRLSVMIIALIWLLALGKDSSLLMATLRVPYSF